MTNQRCDVVSKNPTVRRLAGLTVAGLIACAGLGLSPTPVLAQDQNANAERSNAEILGDYMHFVRIAKYELANSLAQELLARKLSNADLVKLVESTGEVARFEETIQRALRVGSLEAGAGALSRAYERGKLERARSPEEVTRAIAELTGTLRGRLLAEQRLVFAGEYAMPQLLEAFLDKTNPARQAAVRQVMIKLGRQAVMPLAASLPRLTPAQQEHVAELMGQIPWRQSLPFLADLADSAASPETKAAALRAIERLGGLSGGTTSDLYRELSEAYYSEKAELTSFPGEDSQLLWDYVPQTGLVMTAIKTPVYHEAVSMKLAERALQLEGANVNPDTLALWISGNYSREIDTPAGYVNPAYPVAGAAAEGKSPRRPADYFGSAAGAGVAQRVLARAIDAKDTQLARRALAAVQRTGGANVLAAAGGRAPLVEALNYPNRRVQYDAALAIAGAQPQTSFAGSERVVPTLASSIRGATAMTAAVVSPDTEQYQVVRRTLEKLGYTVLPQGKSMADLAAPIAESAAVDLVVGTGVSAERAPELLEEVRGSAKTGATPVVIIARAEAFVDLSRRYQTTAGVAVRPSGIGEDALTRTINELVNESSGGPVSEQEARTYATRSLAALRDLAVSGNPVLNVGDVTPALIAALRDSDGILKLQLADILSRIDHETAQRAVMDTALAAGGPERLAYMTLVSDSAKRFGNKLEERHVNRLLELAGKGGDDEATAAASLLGALNVPNSQLVPLIVR